jgi:hypothetical protein
MMGDESVQSQTRKALAMSGEKRSGLPAALLAVALLTPTPAGAGPLVDSLLHRDPECPRGDYSCLHYIFPNLYYIQSRCRPVSLDQYPPGPSPPVAPSYLFERPRCRYRPPAPTAPYADPEGYFGRPPQGGATTLPEPKIIYP